MKSELRCLAPYLPYGVQMKSIANVVWRPNKNEKPNITGSDATLTAALLADILDGVYDYLSKFKPILRPLSDLTKEIEHNGEKFVPIDIICPKEDYKKEFDRKVAIGSIELQGAINFSCTPFCIVQKLFEWHFDMFGLIDQGLAIDINTLNK